MIKQQQRVIRKGDYYEMQTYEQSMMLISKTKKQQNQNAQNSNINIALNEQILTEIPSWNTARDKYFRQEAGNLWADKGLEELAMDLEAIMKGATELKDEERNQVEMLIKEIVEFAQSQQLQLNNLPATVNLQKAKPTTAHIQHTPITLITQYNLTILTSRIHQLQSLDFPQLISLQHQLQIMLGQKKPLQSLELTHMDQKQKQQLTNLYNHLNSLTIINNTQRVIDSVFSNQPKHVQMQAWSAKMETVQGFNADFLVELRQDIEVVEKLQNNLKHNLKHVKDILEQFKAPGN